MIMKLIEDILRMFDRMERVSKRILAAGYMIALFTYFIAVIVFVIYSYVCQDATTGYYWYRELCLLAKDNFITCIIPVLLFEIAAIGSGIKETEKK